ENDLVRPLDLEDGVDVVAFQKELGLVPIAGEAVEDESVVPIVLFQATLDDFFDNVVGHEFAGGGEPADAGCQFGVTLDVPTKDVADADVDEIKSRGQHL